MVAPKVERMETKGTAQSLTRVERSGLSDEVTLRLREAIQSGDFLPGERLLEQSLSEAFGVSRGPVRDALKQLQREGLVVAEPNKGATVAQLTRQDVEEVFTLRLALEKLAVQSAIRKASEADFVELRRILQRMESVAPTVVTAKEAATMDLDFHDAIYRASKHRKLYNFWEILRPQVFIFLLSRNAARSDYGAILAPYHRRILEPMLERDEKGAMGVIEEHLQSSYLPLIESSP